MITVFRAFEFSKFTIIKNRKGNRDFQYFPFVRSNDGNKEMTCIGPDHGRSFVIGKLSNGRYVVSKGNGLSYTQHSFVDTPEMGDDTLGLLLKQDAIRDWELCKDVAELGIKTNRMECIIEIDREFTIENGHKLKPVLLQYDVECPYRICDAAFMTTDQIWSEVRNWPNPKGYAENYMIAADILISNLRKLHDAKILHNAIHNQNYTWALELLDFELAHSPKHPYTTEDEARHIPSLFPREIIHTYQIINYIGWVLKEEMNYRKIDALFKEYNFEIKGINI
ncbi:MAG: hypothetical protein KBT32_06340 [Bacteroidales bacterium]|nr:hypothetical protein [Candidatus Physcocola equi]